jgi:deoxyadenosine/deoxycytidine kinase
MPTSNVTFISLEGSIGAGKSTIVKAIADLGRDDVIVLQEPVVRWTAKNIESTADGPRTSLLEAYYHDAKSVALAFQMFAMLTRVQQLSDIVEEISKKELNKPILIVAERCSWSDYDIFGKPMHDKGLLSAADWYVYTAWFKAVTESRMAPPLKPSGYAFLNCSPKGCLDRIAHRARPGEEEIDVPYMEALHEAHLRFFEKQRGTGVSVLELDGSAEGPDAVRDAANRIVEWGKSLGSNNDV